MEDRIADAVIDFYSNHSSDGLERDAPRFTRAGLKLAISTAGLADLRRQLAAAERELAQAREVVAELDGVAEKLAEMERENERLREHHDALLDAAWHAVNVLGLEDSIELLRAALESDQESSAATNGK
jgi:predicted nuclease with TOPRIM domain